MNATQYIDDATWTHFWHPVCTLNELRAAGPDGKGPLAVTLLDHPLVVAEIDGVVAAFPDRCIHRSTKLSIGTVETDGLRCAYHGWKFASDGACMEMPASRKPVPDVARLRRYDAQVAYDMVWVRLDSAVATSIPGCPAWNDDAFKVVQGDAYTWPTSAGRRLENFVDLSHFAFVHDGSLGERQKPVVPIADIDRIDGELRFKFVPDDDMGLPDVALMAPTDYRLWVPFTVNLEFFFPDGSRSMLWMTASPISSGTCRSFWFTCRTEDQEGDDQPHLDFQDLILSEDAPVIAAQNPPEIPRPQDEFSIEVDKVSTYYRRWLHELSDAAAKGAAELDASLNSIRIESTSSSAGKAAG